MDANDLVLVQGIAHTRSTLDRWRRAPGRVLMPWLVAALAIALGLLVAVWAVSQAMTPDPTPYRYPGLSYTPGPRDVGAIVGRNLLVLALHGFACVAGYIAGAALPSEATRYSGFWRAIHDRIGRFAMLFVAGATLFSLVTQTYILGFGAAALAAQLHISTALLLVGLAPHAIPELTALFLPLAAWLLAARRERWSELLAATGVTVAIAVPVLVVAAVWETYGSAHLLRALSA